MYLNGFLAGGVKTFAQHTAVAKDGVTVLAFP
jgi:hypothetical protein